MTVRRVLAERPAPHPATAQRAPDRLDLGLQTRPTASTLIARHLVTWFFAPHCPVEPERVSRDSRVFRGTCVPTTACITEVTTTARSICEQRWPPSRRCTRSGIRQLLDGRGIRLPRGSISRSSSCFALFSHSHIVCWQGMVDSLAPRVAPPPRNRPIRKEDYLGALTAVDDALSLRRARLRRSPFCTSACVRQRKLALAAAGNDRRRAQGDGAGCSEAAAGGARLTLAAEPRAAVVGRSDAGAGADASA